MPLPIFNKEFITEKLSIYKEVKILKKSISDDRFEYFVATRKNKR